jgi:outer membrane protein TolC
MKPYFAFTISLLGAFTAQSQVTLDQCQEKAKANYPLIRQYDLIAKSTEYNISNANKAYLPQVSLTGIGAYIFKGIPSLSPQPETTDKNKAQFIGIGQVNQVIWDGGATNTQKEILKAGAEVEKAGTDVAFQALRERVNQIYFGILVIDAQFQQLNVLRENINRNLKSVSVSKNNGLAYQTDVDELSAESMRLDQRVVEFEYTRKGYIDMLNLLTGQSLPDSAVLATPQVPDAGSTEINRPERRLYANQRNLINAQASINKVHNMPKLGVLGAAVLMEPGIKLGPSTLSSLAIGGLSLSWNTAGLYKTSKNKALDKVSLEKIAVQEDVFMFNTNLQLKQVQAEIDKQRSVLAKDKEILDLKSRISAGYQVKYDNGVSSMNDLINAMNKEQEARTQQSLHQVQLLMTIYNYQTLSGN